jgi:hypothetical protein
MVVTDEMVLNAVRACVNAARDRKSPGDQMRAALEAAIAVAPSCPHIRSSGTGEYATNWCALNGPQLENDHAPRTPA